MTSTIGRDGVGEAPAVAPVLRGEVRAAAAMIAVLTMCRVWAAAVTGLNPDETYYWYWSRHLAASYFDHPPMVAYLMRLSTDLFGDSPLGVRLLSLLLVVPISAATYATGRILFGRAVGWRGALWLNATILVGVGSLIATPDMPSVLFWTLTVLAFVVALRTGTGAWWIAVGLMAGLGVMSKLTDLFLAPGLLLCLLALPRERRWLATPWPWLGVAVAVLVLVPVLRWNLDHGLVTFSKQLGRAAPERLFVQGLPEYVAGQYLLLNPGVATFAAAGVALWMRGRLEEAEPGFRLLFLLTAPLVAYFAVHALFDRVQGNWPVPVYPAVAMMAASAAGRAGAGGRLARFRAAVVPFGFVTGMLGLLAFANPFGLIPPRADPVAVMHGWDRFAADVEAMRKQGGLTWIATTNYSIDAVLTYYLRDAGVPVVDVTEPARYTFAPRPDPGLRALPALLVSDKPVAERARRCFARITPLPPPADADGLRHKAIGYRAESPIPGLFRTPC